MAEVLTQNAEPTVQQGSEPVANRPSSPVHSHFFKYYIHDSVDTLRFQLIGDLRAANVRELNGSWETARTTLNQRRFVIDVNQVYGSDVEGRKWLLHMKDVGATFLPGNYLDTGPHEKRAERDLEQESVKLSLLGRIMGLIRG